MTKQLMRRAVQLHPRTDYTADSAVRHARRGYVQAVKYLRERGIGPADEVAEWGWGVA